MSVSDPYNSFPDQRVVGTISGFDKITTDTEEGVTPTSDHDYTIVDLKLLLQEVRKIFKPEYLDRIEAIIYKHLKNEDNPHKTDLHKMNTDVINEIYNVWKEEGNVGDKEMFLKVIFQYVKIADVETALKGESYEQITSVKDVAEMLRVHNEDLKAHDDEFRLLFPGEEVLFNPSYSLKGYFEIPKWDIRVTRTSPMWIISETGTLVEVPPNTMRADFSLGRGAFPLFGPTTNLALESENFVNANYFEAINGRVMYSNIFPDIRNQTLAAQVFAEYNNLDARLHGLKYKPDNIIVEQDKWYTISFYAKPYGRSGIGVSVANSVLNTEYSFAQFDMEEEKIFIHEEIDRIIGHIYPLYSGWYRIVMTFKPTHTEVLHPTIYSLDIYDGDENHEGINDIGFAIFGFMVTETPKITPYIPSLNGVNGTIAGTGMEIPIGDWYNKEQGTFVIDMDMYHTTEIFKNREILTIASGEQQIALNIRYPIGYRDRMHFQTFNKDNNRICEFWSDFSKHEGRSIATFSYCSQKQKGATYGKINSVELNYSEALPVLLNPLVNTIYLGTNRVLSDHYDGYIFGFDYYPYFCTDENIKFFRGEE